MQKQILSAVLTFLCLSVPIIVWADEDEPEDQKLAVVEPAGITSIDGIMIGKPNGRALATAAEYCVQSEQYDKAIKLSQMALDKKLR